jgi:hypothetical protein
MILIANLMDNDLTSISKTGKLIICKGEVNYAKVHTII